MGSVDLAGAQLLALRLPSPLQVLRYEKGQKCELPGPAKHVPRHCGMASWCPTLLAHC